MNDEILILAVKTMKLHRHCFDKIYVHGHKTTEEERDILDDYEVAYHKCPNFRQIIKEAGFAKVSAIENMIKWNIELKPPKEIKRLPKRPPVKAKPFKYPRVPEKYDSAEVIRSFPRGRNVTPNHFKFGMTDSMVRHLNGNQIEPPD